MSQARASFQCTACGNCCRGWTVILDRTSYDRLSTALAPGPQNPFGHGIETTTTRLEPGTETSFAKLKMVDGHCIFLGEDNLCYIHKHMGGATKPLMCQSFPSTAVVASQAVYVSSSFACPGVQEGLPMPGEATLDLVETDANHLGAVNAVALRPTSILYTSAKRDLAFSAPSFEQFALSLRTILALPLGTTEDRLRAIRLYADDVTRPARGRAEKVVEVGDVASAFDAVRSSKGALLLERAKLLPIDPSLQAGVLKRVVEIHREVKKPLAQTPDLLLRTIDRYGLATKAPLAIAEKIEADRQVYWSAPHQDVPSLELSFLAEKLFFSAALLDAGTLQGLHAVAVAYVFAKLFATCLASEKQEPISRTNLLAGFVVAEQQFLHATGFLRSLFSGEDAELSSSRFSILVG